MGNLYGSICVSDIPKQLITRAKNGKMYLNIDIRERKSPDAYGHTHYIKVYDRNAPEGQQNTFIGQLKTAETGVPVNTPPPMPQGYSNYNNNNDDIPF